MLRTMFMTDGKYMKLCGIRARPVRRCSRRGKLASGITILDQGDSRVCNLAALSRYHKGFPAWFQLAATAHARCTPDALAALMLPGNALFTDGAGSQQQVVDVHAASAGPVAASSPLLQARLANSAGAGARD